MSDNKRNSNYRHPRYYVIGLDYHLLSSNVSILTLKSNRTCV